MKNDTFLFKYNTKNVNGTFSSKELKSFFGSKMIDIEDLITIDDSSIQYSDFDSTYNSDVNFTNITAINMNGFQFYKYDDKYETIKLNSLINLKADNHSISLQNQTESDLKNNTKWLLTLDCKNILREYIFFKLKENRIFKCIYYNEVYESNINNFIYEYIDSNLLNRYAFYKINLYVEYDNLLTSTNYNESKITYNPKFDKNVKLNSNLVTNVNVQKSSNILTLNNMQIAYNQTKKSTEYSFNYYFDLFFNKI